MQELLARINKTSERLHQKQVEMVKVSQTLAELRAEIEKTLEGIEHDRKIESQSRGCRCD